MKTVAYINGSSENSGIFWEKAQAGKEEAGAEVRATIYSQITHTPLCCPSRGWRRVS